MRISAALAIGLMAAIVAPSSAALSREKQVRRAAPKQERVRPATMQSKEPFTAEEKRKFQEPTGKEIDRW